MFVLCLYKNEAGLEGQARQLEKSPRGTRPWHSHLHSGPHSICCFACLSSSHTVTGCHMSRRCVCKSVHVSFSSSSCIASYVCRVFWSFFHLFKPCSRSKIAITVQKQISKAIVETRRASYFRGASPVAMLAANWSRLSRQTPSFC
jgi:hypothetical protein